MSALEKLENMEPWDSSPKKRNLSSLFYPHVILLKLFTLFCGTQKKERERSLRKKKKKIHAVIFVHTVKVDGMYQKVVFV